MQAAEILKIAHPEELFPGDPDEAKRKFRELAVTWHPDKSREPQAAEVFPHVNHLYDETLKRLADGTWRGRRVLTLDTTQKDLKLVIKALARREFELGEIYIEDQQVVWIFKREYTDRRDHAVDMIRTLTFAHDRMQQEMARCLPQPHKRMMLADGRAVLAMAKPSGLIRLRDVMDHFGGRLEPRHAAWIQSGLQNLACYLSFTKISHQDISPDTYWISPSDHSGALLGGWWWAEGIREPVHQVNARTAGLLPWEVKTNKRTSFKTDLELTRSVGREMLGDIAGARLHPDAPKPMTDWLKSLALIHAADDYTAWRHAVDKSFGPRRFVEMKLTADAVYRR